MQELLGHEIDKEFETENLNPVTNFSKLFTTNRPSTART